MIRLMMATAAILLACSAAQAQQEEQKQQKPQSRDRLRDELELPIPISSPLAIRPGTVEPLTPKQKLDKALKNTVSPMGLANRFVTTWWDHLLRDPEEWGGNMDAFGKRYAHRMGRLAVRQAVQVSTDVAFGLESRYDRCECSSVWSRTKHAWRRVLVARRDNGGEMFAVSTFAGAYIPPLITDQWYPASKNTWSHKWQSGTSFLAVRGATNMIREFWPEISRKLPIRRFKAD